MDAAATNELIESNPCEHVKAPRPKPKERKALSDEQAGRVIKAALVYLESGEVRPLDPAETLLFLGLKEDIDDGVARYQERCEKNRQNVRKRWER